MPKLSDSQHVQQRGRMFQGIAQGRLGAHQYMGPLHRLPLHFGLKSEAPKCVQRIARMVHLLLCLPRGYGLMFLDLPVDDDSTRQ